MKHAEFWENKELLNHENLVTRVLKVWIQTLSCQILLSNLYSVLNVLVCGIAEYF